MQNILNFSHYKSFSPTHHGQAINMKVIKENGLIKVLSDYNQDFVRKAHELNGKWSSPYWVFEEKNEKLVRQILMDVYGEDGTPQKEVTVDIDLDKYYSVLILIVMEEALRVVAKSIYQRFYQWS